MSAAAPNTAGLRRPAGVPLILVRLKLRLMFNRAKGSKTAAVLAPLAAMFAGIAGFAVAAASSGAGDARDSRALLVLGAAIVLIGWTVFPLVSFGTDETLDPGRLVLLPLQRGPMMRGLLFCSLVGYAPAAVALCLAGVVAGYGHGAGRVVVVGAMAVLFVLCAAAARTASTALAARLTSRRGRDAMVIIGALLALGLQGVRFIRFDAIDPALLDRISDIVRWTPPGMLGQAAVDADHGRLLVAVLELVPPLAVIPLLLALWGRALDRSLTVVTGGSSVLTGSKPTSRLPLLPARLPFISATPWGAVAAKELRYVAREPRRKMLLFNSVLIGAALPLYFGLTQGSLSPAVVLFASLAGYVTVLNSMNQYGFDGGALWIDVVVGAVVRSELIGKNIATLVLVLPAVSAAAVILAAFSGGWRFVPAAIVLGAAGVGIGLSVANVTSVRFPQRLPEARSPFAGRGAGAGCGTAVAMMGALLVQGVLLLPVAIATGVALAVFPLALVVVAPAAALYAFVLWRVGLRIAEEWAVWRQPELLAAVDPRRA